MALDNPVDAAVNVTPVPAVVNVKELYVANPFDAVTLTGEPERVAPEAVMLIVLTS